jgi:hypothetical protein
MDKQSKLLAALQSAARRQTDPVKRQKIVDKIKAIKQREVNNNWLSQ